MRQIISIIIYFISWNTAFCQSESFEGFVRYRTITTSFVEHPDTTESINDTTYSTVYFKNGNFVDVPNEFNEINSKQIFLKDSCRIYYVPSSKKEPIIIYPGTLMSPVLQFDSIPENKVILGISCSGVLIKTEDSNYRSYFSSQHIIDSYDLSGCNYWNIDVIANRIPLYNLIEANDNSYNIEITAIEVVSTNVKDKVFKLPKNRNYTHNIN